MCDFLSYLWPDHSASLLIKGLYVVYYAATVVAIFYTCEQYVGRAYLTDWFDVSKKGLLKKLSWPEVKTLMAAEPLEPARSLRAGLFCQFVRDCLMLVLAGSVWFVGLVGLRVLGRCPSKDNIEVATFLVGFLSVAGAATKVTYEWRLKARSENRQRWIDQIREVLSVLVANIPEPSDFPNERDRKARVYFERHGKLELLMNPSEKDHRALMALIRHIYGYGDSPIDKIPRKELGFAALLPSNREDHIALKSQLIRLSNVALKREWEQVKRIQ